MGYRNQPTSASGVKDVSDKGPTFQDRALFENEKREAERKRLADINKKREESNWRIEQEESLYSADLQAGIRTAANKTNVDYTSLNDSMSNMVSQLSAARIRLKQSSGPYEEMDPEGNVVFNTQTDKSYIKSATDFIKNSETNFGSVAYIQEAFKKMPSGNGEGETSRKFTSPYLGLLNAASNPASGQDVSVSYDMEYDNKSGHRMGIVMKGEAVRRLNAEMGNEGDTYTIKPEEVTNLMMGNNDPENFGLFYQNPSTVSELEKKAATNGILDDGAINSDYMIKVDDAKRIVDELTGTEQMATVSQVNYPVIKQNMAGAIKSKLMTTLDKGMVSTSVLINTYAKQDEDGNYYYDEPRKDGNGNIIYKANGKVDFGSVNEDGDTRNRVYLGDGELEFDMSSDNESFGGLSEGDYKDVYGLIENEFMKRSGVYDPQVVKPYGEKLKFTDETGSMPEWKQTQNYKKNLADQFVNTVGEIDITDEREAKDTARMLSGIIGEGGSVSWDKEKQGFVFRTVQTKFDKDGKILEKDENTAEEAVIKYNPNDPNWRGKLTQEVYNQLGVKDVAGDFKTSKTPAYLKEIPKIQIDYSTYGDDDEKAVKQINDNKALSLLLDKVEGTVKQRDGVKDGVVITYRDPSGTMIEKDIVTGASMTDDEFQKELKSVFKEITLAAGTDTSEADDDFINPFDLTTQGATNTKKEVKDAKISTSQEDQNTETDNERKLKEAIINASKLKGVPEGGF
tara:strand:- start:1435 stop:3651 length:2217 start_codon:yes stop_codon:yes gene_type:complete